MTLNQIRRGRGRPLLLVHGLGAGWRSWAPIIEQLAERREVIAVDLPGFGDTPPSTGEVSIASLTDSVADFIREQGTPAGRTLLLAQLSARPWALSHETCLPDVAGLADATSTGAAMDALTRGPKQQGAPAGTVPGRLTIGWGRRDLVTLPKQAARATELFPDAELFWFERCGHFPQWDAPNEAIRLILENTD